MLRRSLLRLALLLATAGAVAGAFADKAPPASRSDAAAALHALFDDEWELRLRESPLFATSVGDRRFDDRLPQVAPADHARRAGADAALLERLRAIDRGALGEADRVSHDVFAFILEHRVAGAPFRDYRIPLQSDSGFFMTLNWAVRTQPLANVADYENWLARMSAFPAFVDQHIANMRQGLADGFTLPAEILSELSGVVASVAATAVDDSPLYEPFTRLPPFIDADTAGLLQAQGRAAVEQEVLPALHRFRRFFEDEYMPSARRSLAASELPAGEAYYAEQVRFYTNLDLTPEQVHRVGLAEVARIRAEMDAVIARIGFEGSFAGFLGHLRSEPSQYAQTPRELLMHASFLAKKADGKLPMLFGHLPRQPYTVEPVPDAIAPNYTSGRYIGAPIDGPRAAAYWVNTFALGERTLYTLPALTLHEAVPGHHVQIALGKELADLPDFRRHFYSHAFGEGWGLYAEKLGIEMGMYETAEQDFGRLTYEMWRACRLVVDTGMHAMDWTRQEALDYLAGNTALSLQEVRTEIDRYIAWPGQALAYKFGELKFIELRGRAADALGPSFDVRAFHDLVLGQGSVPLPVLEGIVERWIEAEAGPLQSARGSDRS